MAILSSMRVYVLFNRKNLYFERLKRNVELYLNQIHYSTICIRTASDLSQKEKTVVKYVKDYLVSRGFAVNEDNSKIIFIYDISHTKASELEELIRQESFNGTEVFGMIGLEC